MIFSQIQDGRQTYEQMAQTLCPSVTVHPLPNINEHNYYDMKISVDKLLSKLHWSVGKTLWNQLHTCKIEHIH